MVNKPPAIDLHNLVHSETWERIVCLQQMSPQCPLSLNSVSTRSAVGGCSLKVWAKKTCPFSNNSISWNRTALKEKNPQNISYQNCWLPSNNSQYAEQNVSWKPESKAWWGSRDILNIRAVKESTKQWRTRVCSPPHLCEAITYHIATQTSLFFSQIAVMLQLLLHWCWFEQVVTLISQNLHRFGICNPFSLFLSTGDIFSA